MGLLNKLFFPKKSGISNYIIIDTETTGINPYKDEIIEFGAIKVIDNKIVETFCQLVKPRKPISQQITNINNITNEMVFNAPSINRVLPQFLNFCQDFILIGHNVDFDTQMISIACQRFNLPFQNKVIDTCFLSKQIFPKLTNHKLETLTNHLHILNRQAHRALSDCFATNELFQILSKKAILIPREQTKIQIRKTYHTRYTQQTKAINELLKLLSNITDDNKVTKNEAELLKSWLCQHSELCDAYPLNQVVNIIEKSFEDGILDTSELDNMLLLFQNLLSTNFDSDIIVEDLSIKDKNICLSGEFKFGSFEEVTKELESREAIIKKAVSGKVNYLIIGTYGSVDWAYKNFGVQYLKAKELQYKGNDIKIIKEKDFWNALK